MDVQLLEIPTPWAQSIGEELEKERKAFLEGFGEINVVNDDDDSKEVDDAPF